MLLWDDVTKWPLWWPYVLPLLQYKKSKKLQKIFNQSDDDDLNRIRGFLGSPTVRFGCVSNWFRNTAPLFPIRRERAQSSKVRMTTEWIYFKLWEFYFRHFNIVLKCWHDGSSSSRKFFVWFEGKEEIHSLLRGLIKSSLRACPKYCQRPFAIRIEAGLVFVILYKFLFEMISGYFILQTLRNICLCNTSIPSVSHFLSPQQQLL